MEGAWMVASERPAPDRVRCRIVDGFVWGSPRLLHGQEVRPRIHWDHWRATASGSKSGPLEGNGPARIFGSGPAFGIHPRASVHSRLENAEAGGSHSARWKPSQGSMKQCP